MHKLALVGKKISHSRSQQVYEGILEERVDYTKYDVSSESELPRLEDVFLTHEGLSITAPYKSSYVSEVKLIGKAKDLGFINCIRKAKNGYYEATNTDLLALDELFDEFFQQRGHNFKVIVLGSGHMAKVATKLLDDKGLSYAQMSRRQGDELKEYDFSQFSSYPLLIINACSRDFVFRGQVGEQAFFWDFNYAFPEHEEYLSKRCHYIDGMSLLKGQAQHALYFWGILTK